MGVILKVIFLGCLAVLPVSCWFADDFGDDLEVLPSLSAEPQQTATDATPFDIELGGVTYRIEPLHDYALAGLVVSVRHHDGDRMLHKLWNDHLNVADLCVVWGSNADVSGLREFQFWSGQFTCFFRTRDDEAWARFRPDQLSNNHLITADPNLREVIDDVRIGDQVRLRGHLAQYGTAAGFQRGTSTSRDDTGNGACETIYVTDFQIMRSMDTLWRRLEPLSWFGLLLSGVGGLVGIARGAI